MKKVTSSILTLFISLFIISAVAQPTVVNTQSLSIDVYAKSNYMPDSVQFDLSQTLTDLGITSLSEADKIGYYSDGSYRIKESYEMAIWYNNDGYVGDWAVDGVLFVGYEVYGVHGSDMLGVGQFPDSLDAYINQSITVKFGFLANDRIELINITANISEKPPIEGTIVDTQDLDVYLLPNAMYQQDSFLFDLDKTLTDLDIASLDEASPIVFAQDGSYTDEITVENGGYWLSRAGYWAIYDEGAIVWISHENFEDGYFGIGQHPDSLSLGDVFTIKYALLANEKIELLNVTIHVDEPPPPPAILNTQELNIILPPKTGEDYSLDSVQFDLNQTLIDLGIVDLSEATRIAVNEDGSYTDATDAADGTGFWLGKNGYKADWCAGGAVYVTSGNVADGYIGVGQYPDVLSAGDMFTVMYGLLAYDKIEMFNLTIDVRNVGIDVKEFSHQGIMRLESPVRNELRVAISANELDKATLTIYSITGEIVYTEKNITEFEEIDLGHISCGVYFLHFNNGIERATVKFIKH